jgi:hypothetical protein
MRSRRYLKSATGKIEAGGVLCRQLVRTGEMSWVKEQYRHFLGQLRTRVKSQESEFLGDIPVELGRCCSNGGVTRPTVTKLLGLGLACFTDRTACTHVRLNVWSAWYLSRLHQEDDGWGRGLEEGRGSRRHAPARGDVTALQLSFACSKVPTCTSKHYFPL